MRNVGTVVRGIRTPIIKENDDLADIVVDSLLKASESEGFKFRDRDVVADGRAKERLADGGRRNQHTDECAAELLPADIWHQHRAHCRWRAAGAIGRGVVVLRLHPRVAKSSNIQFDM